MHWRLFPALNSMPLAEEGRAFLRWAASYERVCAQHQLLDHARLADTLQDLVRAGNGGFESRVILFGFDQLDSAAACAAGCLTAAGAARNDQRAHALLAESRRSCRSRVWSSEIRTAALWARSRLTAKPGARIGVVVPDLTRLRATVLRIFDEVLVPAALLQPGEHIPRPWNVSLGTALADWPLIHAALLILELSCGELSIERASVLLRSPFVGGARGEARCTRSAGRAPAPAGRSAPVAAGAGVSCRARGAAVTRARSLRRRSQCCARRLSSLPSQPQPVSFWGPALQSLLAAMQLARRARARQP